MCMYILVFCSCLQYNKIKVVSSYLSANVARNKHFCLYNISKIRASEKLFLLFAKVFFREICAEKPKRRKFIPKISRFYWHAKVSALSKSVYYWKIKFSLLRILFGLLRVYLALFLCLFKKKEKVNWESKRINKISCYIEYRVTLLVIHKHLRVNRFHVIIGWIFFSWYAHWNITQFFILFFFVIASFKVAKYFLSPIMAQ